MLEALTPGAAIIISACSCLLCLGFVWSLQVYFLPYFTQRRRMRSPTPRPDIEATTDEELCHSLYAFPGLLHHCPRGSLAECELQSIKWSATIVQCSPLECPPGDVTQPVRTIETRRITRLPSATYSDLRQSLVSYTSLPLPTEHSCSTITTIGHANNSVPSPVKKYRKSMHSLSESADSSFKTAARRHSAPMLSIFTSLSPRPTSIHVAPPDEPFIAAHSNIPSGAVDKAEFMASKNTISR